MNLQYEVSCGDCPVQIEGTVENHKLYFRSRHSHWAFAIDESDPVGAMITGNFGWIVKGDYNERKNQP